MEHTIEAPIVSPGARRLRYLLWPPTEPELADAGRSGEIVIARARLFIVALLLLPSIASERIVGASSFFYGDTSLAGQSEEVCILLIATVLGAIIVERARELRLSGIRDPLTRLANRAYFSERMQAELRRSARTQRPMAVAMIDIDHFKQINDTHGHAAGDLVLKRVAAELRRSLRGEDMVARLGGEEFAMLLSGISREEAQQRLDAVRTTLRSTVIKLRWGVSVRVTVSMGYAMAPDDGTDAGRLLELADDRLLAGKRAGRDIVMAASG